MNVALEVTSVGLLVLAALLAVPTLLLLTQVLIACFGPGPRREIQIPGADELPPCAVLMPAHDEEAGIAASIATLIPQLRPQDRLVVVADNCSDGTAAVARAAGAEVVERHDSVRRGKGYALDFGVRALGAAPPAVVIVVDADCAVDVGALSQLSRRCLQAQRPAQALYLMRAPADAGFKLRLATFAWTLKNHVRPLGYHRLGLPCQLMGTGMAFPWRILEAAPLASGHLVEDLQLGLDLAAAGSPPVFCPEARVTSAFASQAEGLQSQRTRWEHGHLGVIGSVAPRLLARALVRGQAGLAALALDVCVPPLAALVLLTAGLVGAAAALSAVGGGAGSRGGGTRPPRCHHAGRPPRLEPFRPRAGVATGVAECAALCARQVAALRPAAEEAPGRVGAHGPARRAALMGFRSQPDEWTRQVAVCDSPSERLRRDVACVLGLPFDVVGLSEAVEKLRAAAFANTRCFVSTPNLNFVIQARQGAAFRDSVLGSDLSLVDGAPVLWVSRLLGLREVERVPGASVFEALRAHAGPPLRVFFFGGPPGAAAAACQAINAASGGLQCVGHDEAGFGSLDDMSSPERIARINDSGAHFVVAALGARQGQAWLVRNAGILEAPLLCHLGAVVNFAAGTVRRSPSGWQRLGLEWLWRIKEEPALWRRYWNDGRAFLRLVVTEVVPLLRQRASGAAGVEAGLQVTTVSVTSVLTLRVRGSLRRACLGPLKEALAEAIASGQSVDLVLVDVQAIDAFAIGTLLLAYGMLGDARLRLREVPSPIVAALRRHGVGYLLGSGDGTHR
jgi:exopolysaccharide biosynthesis WecB/TagA/CpsF family protein